jgi:hypothetical protein
LCRFDWWRLGHKEATPKEEKTKREEALLMQASQSLSSFVWHFVPRLFMPLGCGDR